MYNFPGDYLMTYDPGSMEEHDNSSDFEESCMPMIDKKGGNHSLLTRKAYHKKILKNPHEYKDCDKYPVKLKREYSQEFWETQPVSLKKYTSKNTEPKSIKLNHGDQPEQASSKLSIIRNKVIPCFSNLFRKSRTKDNMSVIHENPAERAKYSRQKHYNNCERKQVKKLYKRQQTYAVQPVYAIEGHVHSQGPAVYTPEITEKPLNHRHKTFISQYSTCSIYSSSESEIELSDAVKRKKNQMRKRFKTEILKEHWKYHQNQHCKNQQHQFPSKDNQTPYHVYSSPYQQSKCNNSPVGSYLSELPPSSSGFWDYLFNKITKKYQIQKIEISKPCMCSSSEKITRCTPVTCDNLQTKPDQSSYKEREQNISGNSCPCAQILKQGAAVNDSPYQKNSGLQIAIKNSYTLKAKPPEKIECKCYEKEEKQSKSSDSKANSRPCQENHNQITESLAEKYRGEILCIHNPPCVLINGCLNFPPPKEPSQKMNCCQLAETKSGFYNTYKTKNFKELTQKCDHAVQYDVPFFEVRQCQTTPSYKAEKNIQSICHHKPPCEVVRGCYRAKYDPKLQNSCIHVPMCPNIPECLFGQESIGKVSCEHRPRCADMPLCSRNYGFVTATENFGAQVKPRTNLICRHVPPCIMIPKCLGRVICDGYIPSDAIPDCTHQPTCEMIPACCRKSTKEMITNIPSLEERKRATGFSGGKLLKMITVKRDK